MELAKISSKGQVTIPKRIRNKLGLKEGDKILFLEDGDNIVLANASMVALRDFQEAMKGKAQKQGLETEEDVNRLTKEIRKELWSKRYEGND